MALNKQKLFIHAKFRPYVMIMKVMIGFHVIIYDNTSFSHFLLNFLGDNKVNFYRRQR